MSTNLFSLIQENNLIILIYALTLINVYFIIIAVKMIFIKRNERGNKIERRTLENFRNAQREQNQR